jgi:glycosyltransferase involved in cell wall biosynthesis
MSLPTPWVTVIIPNYNHARYLPQRIESVLNQTLHNLEVLILDDCSTDNSRTIIAEYAFRDSRIHVIQNKQNSGSTFKQWNKGIAQAQGKYVWLAESDDYADSTLLETLVGRLEADPSIGLAYCDSRDVDEQGRFINQRINFYEELDSSRWTHDFVESGQELVRKYMSYRNIIPNASAVVIRHALLIQVGAADETYRLNGDWVFWARLLLVTNVCFVAAQLNYFRHHTTTVRSSTAANGTALIEKIRVVSTLTKLTSLEPFFLNRMLDTLTSMWVNSMLGYATPISRHQQIFDGLRRLDKQFSKRLRQHLTQYLVLNRLSQLQRLIKQQIMPALFRK